jgi:DNA-binding response OmpR family regulator
MSPAGIHSETLPYPAAHIIVVEDDDHFRELLTLQISDLGLKVTAFKDGLVARDEIPKMRPTPQFVLLDLALPRLNGLELLKSIREDSRTRHLPTAIITGQRDDRLLKACLKLGVKDFMLKPIAEGLLRSRLECFKLRLESNDARALLSQCLTESPQVFGSQAFKRFRNKNLRPFLVRHSQKTLIALMDMSFSREQLLMLDEDMMGAHFRIYADGAPWIPVWPHGGIFKEFKPINDNDLRNSLGGDLFDLVKSCAGGGGESAS